MKQNKLIVFLMSLFVVTSASGQVSFSGMGNDSADSLQKCSIRYFTPGKGGRGKVWDFSRKLSSRATSQVMFLKDSTGVVSVVEPGKTSRYLTTPDTLVLIGTESRLQEREYVRTKLSKVFPLAYDGSVRNRFRCEGMYCGNHPFREVGTTLVKVDAEGSVVLAENDTLRDVKRVHTIDTYSVCMDLSREALDTARLTQVIDERYEWYLPESQYPIFESVTSTTYSNMDAIGTTKCAFCNLPEDMAAHYITEAEDEEEETEEDDNSFDEETTEPDIIHYKVETSGGVIRLSYELDEEATITTIVASHMGMTYKHKTWTQDAGQGYTAQIDCNGLRQGTYILYINVNGKIYSEKVRL